MRVCVFFASISQLRRNIRYIEQKLGDGKIFVIPMLSSCIGVRYSLMTDL